MKCPMGALHDPTWRCYACYALDLLSFGGRPRWWASFCYRLIVRIDP